MAKVSAKYETVFIINSELDRVFKITEAIKRARHIALLPYVND